jgi:hypothetical protein
MGNQLSHCGSACQSEDAKETRMELRDSGEAPESQPRSAYNYGGRSSSVQELAADVVPSSQMRLSPRGPVGRKHSVQRSFRDSPTKHKPTSDADRMLEELRTLYVATGGRHYQKSAI